MAVAEMRHASEVDAEITRHQHVLTTQQQKFRAEQDQREREQAALAARLASKRAEAAKYKTAHEQRIKHVQAIAARHHGVLLLLPFVWSGRWAIGIRSARVWPVK